MTITLEDVAKQAGVSMKTVSRVVNNEKYVAEKTRQHVLKVIEEIGYAPHIQAQRLASGRTQSIALHYPLTNPGLISNLVELNFITGVAVGVAQDNYYFNLMTGSLTPTDLLNICRGAHADGLILMQISVNDWRVELLREHQYPFVLIGRCDHNDAVSFIDLDFEQAMLDVFAHLVGLGHRHIGLLTYPSSWRQEGLGPAVRALNGFEAAIKTYQLPRYYRESDLTIESAYAATNELLQECGHLTAFVVMHNTIAVGALSALQDRGSKVPNDYSLIGIAFGNESELIIPPLTAVDWSGQDVGQQAAQILIRQLQTSDTAPQQILVAPKLTIRRSTAPVARHATSS
jgi:DNA-binding LacI/PurR family transcriptional regulator